MRLRSHSRVLAGVRAVNRCCVSSLVEDVSARAGIATTGESGIDPVRRRNRESTVRHPKPLYGKISSSLRD
jgi:hypothetical protein